MTPLVNNTKNIILETHEYDVQNTDAWHLNIYVSHYNTQVSIYNQTSKITNNYYMCWSFN